MVMRGLTGLLCVAISAGVSAQTPQPFPTPRSSAPASPAAQQPKPAPPPPATAAPAPPPAKPAAATARVVGPEIHGGGIERHATQVRRLWRCWSRGQRFHLYGVTLPYLEAVTFYRTALKAKGDELFESPPTHQFDLGRFRDSDVAFPPSVTVKDYTRGGAAGFPNPKAGEKPERFPTIIQIVPPPPATK